MNVPVYFNTSARFNMAATVGAFLLMPVFSFAVSYLFNDQNAPVAALSAIVATAIGGVTLLLLRKMFAKYFRKGPAFILRDDAIETSSGGLVLWDWFDQAVVFTVQDIRMLGLHRKPEVKKTIIGESIADFDGSMFGYPFVIELHLFSTVEPELIKLFRAKLPVKIDGRKLEIEDVIDWDNPDS
jgi:hypothetical protein